MVVYGMNHVALEVTEVDLTIKFYAEVVGFKRRSEGEGQAFFAIQSLWQSYSSGGFECDGLMAVVRFER